MNPEVVMYMSFQLSLMAPDFSKRIRAVANCGEQVQWREEAGAIAFFCGVPGCLGHCSD